MHVETGEWTFFEVGSMSVFLISRSVVSRDMVEEKSTLLFSGSGKRESLFGGVTGLLIKGLVFSVSGCYRRQWLLPKIVRKVPTLVV